MSKLQRQVVTDAALPRLLRRCAAALGVADAAELTVRLTTDSELLQLNSQFRGEPHVTDVLAFPNEELGVGDIAISVERAVAQAPQDPVSEVRLLAVHGLLHCLGHDHDIPERAAAMTHMTRQLLPEQAVPELIAADS